ncbi:MAG: hypothetical protein KGM96_03210, partial [Acidobacteriota bacterium]|nr:hypothetical protein [Acidobacteriota bacterium]
LGASVAALIVNPYGWRLMWEPLDMAFKQKLSVSVIAEWQPLDLSMREGKMAVAAIVLMVLANAMRARKWKIYEMAFVFLAWYAAFAHLRFLFFAAVVTTPMLARDIERAFCIESDEKTIPVMNALMVAGAICVVVFMFPTETALKKMQAMMFPLQTIRSVQPSWRTLNWDYIGGMMDFESKPSAIDTRMDSFDHSGVLPAYLAIMAGQNSLELMDKFRFDHALLKEAAPLAYLLQNTPGWRVVTREKAWDGDYYVLYAKIPTVCPPAVAPAQH